jgi:VCBS repeat-containing protein
VPAANFSGTPGSLTARLVETGSIPYTTPGVTLNVSGANSGGTTQISASGVNLTTTITAVPDTAVVGGVNIGSVTEETQLAATGQLTVTDPDPGQAAFNTVSNAAGTNGHGTFSINTSGSWLYNLNNTAPAVQALGAGQSITDSYTFSTIDGTTTNATVSVTINGTNDAPTLSRKSPVR